MGTYPRSSKARARPLTRFAERAADTPDATALFAAGSMGSLVQALLWLPLPGAITRKPWSY